jgi:hypothetical protein
MKGDISNEETALITSWVFQVWDFIWDPHVAGNSKEGRVSLALVQAGSPLHPVIAAKSNHVGFAVVK